MLNCSCNSCCAVHRLAAINRSCCSTMQLNRLADVKPFQACPFSSKYQYRRGAGGPSECDIFNYIRTPPWISFSTDTHLQHSMLLASLKVTINTQEQAAQTATGASRLTPQVPAGASMHICIHVGPIASGSESIVGAADAFCFLACNAATCGAVRATRQSFNSHVLMLPPHVAVSASTSRQ